MWVWKISQHACGRFLRSSYNPTEWDWNPGFPHYSRGKTTDLGFVGLEMLSFVKMILVRRLQFRKLSEKGLSKRNQSDDLSSLTTMTMMTLFLLLLFHV